MLPDNEKKYEVFICYRREPALPNAMLLQAHLELRGISVYRDPDRREEGWIPQELKLAIQGSRHIMVLLSPDFLDACSDPQDSARQEISTALQHGLQIIPVVMEGFSWPRPEDLPADIRPISGLDGVTYSTEFFNAFIDRLVSRLQG